VQSWPLGIVILLTGLPSRATSPALEWAGSSTWWSGAEPGGASSGTRRR